MLSDLERSELFIVSSKLYYGSLSGELSELDFCRATLIFSSTFTHCVYGLLGVASFVGDPGSRVLLCGRIPAVVERIGMAVRPWVIGLMVRRAVAVGGVVVPVVMVVLVVIVRLSSLNASGEEGQGEKCSSFVHFVTYMKSSKREIRI